MTRLRKSAILLVLLFVNAALVNAQDIIYKTDKTEIKAKVEEIEETKVKYKLFDNLDGPSYSLPKSQIFMIIYKNGRKEVFTETSSPTTQSGNISGSEIPENLTDFFYAPIRLTSGFQDGVDFSILAMADFRGSRKAASSTAPFTAYINPGIMTGGSFYSDDHVSSSSYSFGAYGLWYAPVNKLTAGGNPNLGLFPYVYAGGVGTSTSTEVTISGEDTVSSSSFDFDIALGIGLDWKFFKKFGASVRYDINTKGGDGVVSVGVNFNI